VASSTLAYEIAGALFLPLLEELPGSPPSFAPRLARSWTIADDGLSVTFTLRDDVVWSDGRPVTAEDVRFTWQAQVDAGLGWYDADLKKNIADVRVDSPGQVTFVLSKPSPYALLDINEGRILPRHVYADLEPEQWHRTDFSKGLVTNGPFRLAEWKPGQAIILERNPRYYEEGLPGLDRIVFRIVPDAGIRMQQLLAGETDVLHSVPPEAAGRIVARDDLRLVRLDQRMYTYICWNNRRPPFDDPRVRRALTMALDRDAILRTLAHGMGRPSASPIVSSQWAADPSLRPLPFDRAGAKRLLEQAGWSDSDGDGVLDKDGKPLSFDLEFNRGNTLRENIALNAAAQLAEVGVRAVPRSVEWARFQAKHNEGDFDAFVASRIASTRVNLESYTTGAPRNYPGYSNPEIDRLNALAVAASSFDEARPLWHEAQKVLAQDQPIAHLFEQDRLHAVNRRLEGVDDSPLGLFGEIRKWRARPAAAASAAGAREP